MSRFYSDDVVVGEQTKRFVSEGTRLLQPFLFHEDERSHVSELLAILSPAHGARILDLACGIGEAARLMHEERRDLRFTLQNFSAAQLALCPPFEKMHGDAATMPIAGQFDAVMMMAALGHFDLSIMARISALLPSGGKFLLYDIFADGDARHLLELDYCAHPLKDVIFAAANSALTVSAIAAAPRIRGVKLDDFDYYFANVSPAAVVFLKETAQ